MELNKGKFQWGQLEFDIIISCYCSSFVFCFVLSPPKWFNSVFLLICTWPYKCSLLYPCSEVNYCTDWNVLFLHLCFVRNKWIVYNKYFVTPATFHFVCIVWTNHLQSMPMPALFCFMYLWRLILFNHKM